MRVIKFRALIDWDDEGMFWEYYTTFDQPTWMSFSNVDIVVKDLQFTGLLDKNGKEIYEGDIIGCKDDPNYFVIVWDKNYASFAANLQNNNSDVLNEINEGWMKELEIIGNIYENKRRRIEQGREPT